MAGRLIKADKAYFQRVKEDKFARGGVHDLTQLDKLAGNPHQPGIPTNEKSFMVVPVLCDCGVVQSIYDAFMSSHDIMVCEKCDQLYWPRDVCMSLRSLLRIEWVLAFELIMSLQDWKMIYPIEQRQPPAEPRIDVDEDGLYR